MNNEIKEILEDLKTFDENSGCPYELSGKDCQLLLDYITNLQEENKHLDEVNCKLRKGGEALKNTNKLLLQQKEQLQKDLDILDKRIDKAIEYIKNTHHFTNICEGRDDKGNMINTKYEDLLINKIKVLNILEGDDKRVIPDNIEKIIMTKEDYDRNVEKLLFDKINAEKEVERLNKECDTYMKIATKRGNIINELEKWLINEYSKYNGAIRIANVLDKLKELKGE